MEPNEKVIAVSPARRRRRRLIAFASMAVAVLLLISLSSSGDRQPSLSLAIAGIEPSGIFQDGLEMWLLNLRVANTAKAGSVRESYIFIKDGSAGVQARAAGGWTRVEGTLGFHGLSPGAGCERLLLIPGDTDVCRACVRYTGPHLFMKGRLAWLAERLPQSIRYRLGRKFWLWVGFSGYQPSANWREVTLELPIPKTNSIADDRTRIESEH